MESFGRAAINAITIAPKLYLIPGRARAVHDTRTIACRCLGVEFDQYFTNLIPSKNTRNPWFREYWEETYKCKFPDTPMTSFNQNFTRVCTGKRVDRACRLGNVPCAHAFR